MNYGLQLYSVRDTLQTDYRGTLHQVAALGYKTVETYHGMGPEGPETLKRWVEEEGLAVSGTHTYMKSLADETIVQTIEDHHTIGCSTIIIPSHDLTNRANVEEFIRSVNKVQPVLAAEGITLAYHNHARELQKNTDGDVVYPELVERTNLCFELDVYWAFAAGFDPLKMMEDLGERLVAVHLKDGLREGKGCPLGEGEAPIRAVWQKGIKKKIPMTVESESLTPDGMTEARICMEYLKKLEEAEQ